MFQKKQWEMMLGEHRLPCLLADIKTGEVLYINEAVFGISGDIIGKNLETVLQTDTKIPSLEFLRVWQAHEVHEQKLYNCTLNRSYLLQHMYLDFGGQSYHFCKFKPDNNLDFNFEESMSRCIVASHEEESVPTLLKILGEYYSAEKAYLYQILDNKIPCVASWLRDDSMTVTQNLSEKMDGKKLLEWFSTRNVVGMLDADRSHGSCAPGSTAWEVLDVFNLDNIVMSVVENGKGSAMGVLLLTNRQNLDLDFRLIQGVTHFMAGNLSHHDLNATVQKMSGWDILTGFCNRMSYSETLEYMETRPPKKLGVVMANVNGLKRINSEFGLSRGDSYIKKAAKMIQDHFDCEFYRTAGDEFVGFFPDMEKEIFQQQVSDLLEEMKSERNHMFALGHAWGKGRVNVLELVKEADTVMYINKQEFYHDSVSNFRDITDNTLQDLLSALVAGEFIVYLQPQVILEDASLYGAEALVRRIDGKTKKMMYPDQFIPLYETKSVIRHIDIFVIEEVCSILSQWQSRGVEVPISVNLSRVTLLEHGIVDTIAAICDNFMVNRSNLVIEVTERVGLIENNVPSSLVNEFKEKGFKISLDDFGCAYSNIVTLAQIEVDEVKIDKSLVDYLETNSKNRVLMKNVLSMCQELDSTSTLAEGIENQDQADLLQSLGCHLGQGYFYSEPIPVEEFTQKYFDF